MSGLDIEKLKLIVQNLYSGHILVAYGDNGVSSLKELLEKLRQSYQFIEPEIIKGSLIFFKPLSDKSGAANYSGSKTFSRLEYLAQDLHSDTNSHDSAIQICDNGDYFFWKDIRIDIKQLSENSIVYKYKNRQEFFIIKGSEHIVPNPDNVYSRVFSIPTFRNLKDALDEYKLRWIKSSHCKIFCDAWHDGSNGPRLFFKNKPESIMRDSLAQFLDQALRGAEVRPEQTVDTSHPVDIKVTWMFTNRLALIEIKWLGKSINRRNKLTNFANSRALEGAKQLADYLDANLQMVSTHNTRGYLVVFDARRRGIKPTSTEIDPVNGYWYANKEIEYNPLYHSTRKDFEEPIRMFAEPRCS